MQVAKRVKRPLVVAVATAIVGGMSVVSVLPGAGLAPTALAAESTVLAATERDEGDAQEIALDDTVTLSATSSIREAFDAQSVQQQRAALASGDRTNFIVSPGYVGDDYPWSGITWGQSSLNYTMGQCTDFVAWRLNRDVGSYGEPWALPWSVLTPNGGNAREWLGAWEGNGWSTGTEPVIGAVAWFGWDANHVAYVSAVNGDGTILIEEYNWDVTSGYGARTIPASSIPVYLYPPGW